MRIVLGLLVLATVASFLHALDSPSLILIRHPESQTYEKSVLKTSDLEKILFTLNGLPIQSDVEWTGLKNGDPFSLPKATLLFLADKNKVESSLTETSEIIPVKEDSPIDLNALKNFNGVFRTFSSIPSDFGLEEINKDCASFPSLFYVFKLSDSAEKDSIEKIVQNVQISCKADLKKDLLVYLLAESRLLRRSVRDAQSMENKNNTVNNLAEFYSDQYPAMFNLIFWTSLLLALAVIGIVYALFQMDPGLDTVIYRMTSQRIKKDQ